MDWNKLLSKKNYGAADTSVASTVRTEFDRDCDRILFSGSFRRLSGKTQVHPLAANDHVHNRLTHSLEVSRVGRTLGKTIGQHILSKLPNGIEPHDLGSIVEAACLAHDIGNPPFGHAGEAAMKHWFELNSSELFSNLPIDQHDDIVHFEGNAQGFRQLTQTENHLFHGGMRLTYATLGTFLKYPWTSEGNKKKFSSFLSEREILNEVASELGLLKDASGNWCRHPLAYLVEAADDICYAVLDLEDAVELKILAYEEVEEFMLRYITRDIGENVKAHLQPKEMFRVNLTRLRGPIFDLLVENACNGFVEKYDDIMNGNFVHGGILEALDDENPAKQFVSHAKKMASERVFSDQKKVEIELGSFSTFETLLKAFCSAAIDQSRYLCGGAPKEISWKSKLVLNLLGDHSPRASNPPPDSEWTEYQCLRRVMDFISGMTDSYATYVAHQIRGTGYSGSQRP